MEKRELEDIERFFAGLGHKTPLAYYGLPEDAEPEAVDAAVKKRRTWAQGQQANPKYRAEALFLIKSNNALRRLLLEQRDEYAEHFGEANPRLSELNDFVRKQLSERGWNPPSEVVIRALGRRLQLEDSLVEARIQTIARDLNVKREGDADLGDLGAIDAYSLLAAEPTASAAELEAAYRARYRWARSLKDHEKSGQVLAALDAAWRILQNPDRRAAYDAHRVELGEATEEVEKGARELGKLLGGAGATESSPDSAALLEAVRNSGRVSGSVPEPPPFAMPVPAASEPVSVAEPPVAPEIQGRTIGLASGPQMVRDRAPRLKVPVKTPVVVQLPRSGGINWALRIVNDGQGRMPGKVVSDVPWLVPARDWLDPLARQQDVIIEVVGSLMPAAVATGTITVVTDHGQRVPVQIEARKATLVGPLLAVLALLGLIGGGLAGFQYWKASQQEPVPVSLRLTLDPPAEAVLVDGSRAGAGVSVELVPPNPGVPFRVRVERPGFRPHEEMITLGEASLSRTIRLDLTDKLDWKGGEGEPAAMAEGTFAPIAAARESIRKCLGGATGSLRVVLRADDTGAVRGLDLDGEGIDLAAARPCVGRVARVLAVPAPEGASWSQGETMLQLAGTP